MINRVEWDTLLVEDNEDDAFILQRAFRTAGVAARITHCRDGRNALDYFQGESDYGDPSRFPLPHVLILDLKLPFRNGIEVLRWLRAHPEFKKLIVVILTSSSEDRDVQEAHQLQANAYLVKPSSLDGMVELARCIQACWINNRLGAIAEPSKLSEAQ